MSLILVTTVLGYYLGQGSFQNFPILILTLIGAAFVSGGSSTLNHYLDREADGKMNRTQNRPIPSGIILPNHALTFGLLLVLAGVALLCWKVNILTAFLALLTAFLYVLVYTPMKKVSWLNTTIGAIPGAIPPMGGWAAATGRLDLGAWILFAILFLWQHPHFYAIAWMLRDDYKRGGFKMLPVVEPDGAKTFFQIKLFSIILIPISILPFFMGMTGIIYFWGALLMGMWFYMYGVTLGVSHTGKDAKNLLKASVIYLPVLLLLIVIDIGVS